MFKCSGCGAWVDDNPVFLRLGPGDIEIIKSKDLIPATPSLLSFQATAFFEDDITSLIRQFGSPQVQNGYAYLSAFAHATAVRSGFGVKKKVNRAPFLNERIAIEFLANAIAVAIFDIEPSHCLLDSDAVYRNSTDPRVAAGLEVFDLLGDAMTEVPLEPSDADMIGCARKVASIIFGDSPTIPLMLDVMDRANSWMELAGAYGKYFLVDEEDFEWGSLAVDAESSTALTHWLSRFA